MGMIDRLNNIGSYNVFPLYSSRNSADSSNVAAKADSGAAEVGKAAKNDVVKEVKPVAKKDADAKVNNGTKQPEETAVRFKLHKGTGATIIQIVDSSGKIIKEIPPEKILDSIAQIWKNAGIKVDKSV